MQLPCELSAITSQQTQRSHPIPALAMPPESDCSAGIVSYTSADSLMTQILLAQKDRQPSAVVRRDPLGLQGSTWGLHGSFATTGLRDLPVLQLDSVRRKRASKMNKHKHRKRRRRDRAARK